APLTPPSSPTDSLPIGPYLKSQPRRKDDEGAMPGDVERAIALLKQKIAPDRVMTAPEDMVVYSYDGTWVVGRPQIAVTVLDADEIGSVVRVASEGELPIVPRGAASGLAGGAVPLFGGIVLNMTRMNKILEIDRVNMTVVTEPGVVTATLQAAVERQGLFYP